MSAQGLGFPLLSTTGHQRARATRTAPWTRASGTVLVVAPSLAGHASPQAAIAGPVRTSRPKRRAQTAGTCGVLRPATGAVMVVAGARAGPPPLGRQFLRWLRLRMAGMSRTGSPRVSWPGPPICKEAPPTREVARWHRPCQGLLLHLALPRPHPPGALFSFTLEPLPRAAHPRQRLHPAAGPGWV